MAQQLGCAPQNADFHALGPERFELLALAQAIEASGLARIVSTQEDELVVSAKPADEGGNLRP